MISEFGIMMEMLSLVLTVVALEAIFTISPVTVPTSILSLTLIGLSKSMISPEIKLLAIF